VNERTQIQPKTETPSFSPSPSLAPRTNLLQRKCACGGTPGIDGECAECRKKRLQRRSIGQAGPSTVPSIVPDVLRSPGEPLDAAARAFMEPRFGHDFSQVRIHTDAKAAESAQAVNAVAYTVGSSIVFGRGQFAPQTAKGRRLLAHELAHTVQQQGVRGEAQDTGLDLTAQSLERSLEREADTHAERVVTGHAAEPGQLQKQLGVARLQRLGDPAQAPAGMACPIAQSSAGGIGSDIFFGSAGRTLTPSQQADIAAFVSNWHASGADAAVRIDGYASVEGTQTFNWQVSCDRALAVAAEMVAPSAPGAGAGIPPSFITFFAQGETTEFSTTAPDPNRRVVISINFPAPVVRVQPPPAPAPAPGPQVSTISHEDCTDADLRTHIRPADLIAKTKVAAAIAAVSASPVSPRTVALFVKYFMTATPNVTEIAQVFREVKAAFDGDRYTYECEDDCDPGEYAYTGLVWDIHLCMNNIRGRDNACNARTIIHEFTHKYAGTGHGWWFSTARCYNGCDTAGCPLDLSPSDALDNAYSFAGFAHEV
jgi:outer membrane protein OmpA-like peptidoglycan-associated protein